MTITITASVFDSGGLDTRFLFPGLRDMAWQRTDGAAADVDYRAVGSDYPLYRQHINGSNLSNSSFGDGIEGFVTSFTLAKQTSLGGPFVLVAGVSIDFGDSGQIDIAVSDSFGLTPTNFINATRRFDDVIFKANGNAGNDMLYGSAYADILDGQGGADVMNGDAGNDRYYVDNVADRVAETEGNGSDYVLASVSFTLKAGTEVERLSTTNTNATTAITLSGNEFGQRIDGNGAGNKLSGLGGNDTLYGFGGNDALYGGDGKDTLVGGLGNDSFIFDTALGSGNIDTIADFHNASGDNDTIRLENAVFTKLTTVGTLNAANFAANATGTAADGNDYVLYNTSTGALFYDADGNGAVKAIQFATLTGHPALTAADFLVV